MLTVRRLLPLSAFLLGCTTSAPGVREQDDLDRFVLAQMARRNVPGLSLAVIQDGRIVEARAYGVREAGGRDPVTPTTLFQAGSISKAVAALGALHLVEEGKLTLDGDVNATLKSWKVPANSFTASKPVTVRGLLSHSAGLTVHGFPGYAVDAPMPTLIQVLDGAPPANTAPIRVDVAPGSVWRYSGGGYTVLQQLMLDVTGQSFPDYMRRTVLEPIGMTESSYEQPLPPAMAAATASGHLGDRRVVMGRWHLYPEMAAAGLWTTPTDLARFAIEIQQSHAGRASKVISAATTRQMLTRQKDDGGLGLFLQGSGPTLLFNHNGRDEGFDASMNAFAESGQGLVVMINANDNSRMINRIIGFVARRHRWPNASTFVAPVAGASLSEGQLLAYAGRYELTNNNMLTLVPSGGRLYSTSDGYPDEEFIPLGNDRFASADRPVSFSVTKDENGDVVGMTWTQGSRERAVPRIGPLVRLLPRQSDPDPSFTEKVATAVRAMAQGGSAVSNDASLTAGARRDFGRGAPWPPAVGMRALSFVASQDVGRRKLERHDHPVQQIRYYDFTTDAGTRTLLVYVTSDGLITDFDVVDDQAGGE